MRFVTVPAFEVTIHRRVDRQVVIGFAEIDRTAELLHLFDFVHLVFNQEAMFLQCFEEAWVNVVKIVDPFLLGCLNQVLEHGVYSKHSVRECIEHHIRVIEGNDRVKLGIFHIQTVEKRWHCLGPAALNAIAAIGVGAIVGAVAAQTIVGRVLRTGNDGLYRNEDMKATLDPPLHFPDGRNNQCLFFHLLCF